MPQAKSMRKAKPMSTRIVGFFFGAASFFASVDWVTVFVVLLVVPPTLPPT